MTTLWMVEEGIWSQRDACYNWRYTSQFQNRREAQKEAKRMFKNPDPCAAKYATRVVQIKIEAEFIPGVTVFR